MAKPILRRIDIAVIVKRTEDGGALVRIVSPNIAREIRLPDTTVYHWLDLGADTSLAGLADLLSLTQDSPALQDLNANVVLAGTPIVSTIARLTFDVANTELAALAWERSMLPHLPAHQFQVIVRVSPVAPRAISAPLTLPLRFLSVDLSPHRQSLQDTVRDVFGSYPEHLVAQAVQTAKCAFADLDIFRAHSEWPTADVLHFDRFPTLEAPDILMTTAAPEQPGTLGWLARLAMAWQTRLIVIHCDTGYQAAQARRLAAALVNRGGPAVLIGYFPDGNAEAAYGQFYAYIIHDQSLDASFASIAHDQSVMFVGAGRSEALRISAINEQLLRLANELGNRKRGEPFSPVAMEIRRIAYRSHTPGDPDVTLYKLQHYLSSKSERLERLAFQFHETEGLLPLIGHMSKMRRMVGWQPPKRSAIPSAVIEKALTAPRRYTNLHFWGWAGGELTRLDQKKARLLAGQSYHLGVQIGPGDEQVRVIGVSALGEEVFKWTPDMQGVWLDVGLTGLDFEVLGDLVQELWLPREGTSETIYFAVAPQTPGVARLRVCLYYKSDLIQSFRLAVLTQTPGAEDPPQEVRAQRLARSLDLPVEVIGDEGYLVRLEYSVTASLEDTPNRAVRAISLVANNLDGRSVITVKGPNLFEIRTNADLPDRVKSIRDTLERIATPSIPGVVPDKWLYGFGVINHPNAGDETRLKNALIELATLGWKLYDAVVCERGRKHLAAILQPEQQVIHVAHILLEKVIPWSLLYDRKYDPERELDDDANRITHDVCLAALPDESGRLPVTECGAHPNCLLHSSRCEERKKRGEPSLLSDTVVCPLHFWGFKHIVELPPQQIAAPNDSDQQAGDNGQEREQQTCILASSPAQMTSCIHAFLPQADDHVQELEEIAKNPAAKAIWKSRASHRDIILKNLKDTELDLIYFYCHAGDQDLVNGSNEPYLEFQDREQAQPRRIDAGALDYEQPWGHHPLVFLNGCRTAGFSPRALSPFITKLVAGRGASGVIGTEVSVWEPLAREMALRFLGEFLTGRTAGNALLIARRALLAQCNPLGLIYTLYAAANLAVDLDGDGKCTPELPSGTMT